MGRAVGGTGRTWRRREPALPWPGRPLRSAAPPPLPYHAWWSVLTHTAARSRRLQNGALPSLAASSVRKRAASAVAAAMSASRPVMAARKRSLSARSCGRPATSRFTASSSACRAATATAHNRPRTPRNIRGPVNVPHAHVHACTHAACRWRRCQGVSRPRAAPAWLCAARHAHSLHPPRRLPAAAAAPRPRLPSHTTVRAHEACMPATVQGEREGEGGGGGGGPSWTAIAWRAASSSRFSAS
jgi:hypothetical protein